MAHSLFDAIAGVTSIDNSTYLAVQSLLDTQNLSDQQPTSVVQQGDDDDVFQCGKCKKQFTTLQVFVNHKNVCNGPQLHVSSNNVQHYAATRQSTAISPTSGLHQLSNAMVLPDDIMTLTLDQNSALQVQGNGMQNNPFLSSAQSVNGSLPQTSTFQTPTSLASVATTVSGQLHLQPVTLLPMNSNNNSGNLVVSRQQLGTQPNNNMITVIVDGNAEQTLQAAANSMTQPITLASTVTQHKPVQKSQSSVGKGQRNDSKKILSCQYCDKNFGKKFDLQQHMRAHTGEKPFQCVVCGRAFSQKSNVKKHMQTHKVWPSKGSSTLPEQPEPQLLVVQETEPPDETLENSENGQVSATVKWHYFVDNSFVCPYCPEPQKFETYYKLRSHMVRHKNVQVYKCIKKECSQTFDELDDFLEHVKTHETDMTYRCHVCSKRFPSLYDLGAHQYSHTLNPDHDVKSLKNQWSFKCTLCSSIYSSPEALEQHLATSSHQYSCPHCSKVYPCERYLRRHLIQHDSSHEHKCTVCNKAFKTDQYLKLHMFIHTGEKPFSCTVCGKRFNRKDKVKRHLLTHDEEKRFKCPFKEVTGCDRAFHRADKLKEHLVKHTTPGPVTKTVNNKTKIEALMCRFCQHCKFQTHSQLVEHETLCIQVPRLNCNKCQLTFNNKEMLDNHECIPPVKPSTSTSKTPIYRRKRKSKRPRGRPPKTHLTSSEPVDPNRPKRKPGRPRRRPLELEVNDVMVSGHSDSAVEKQQETDQSDSHINVVPLDHDETSLLMDPLVSSHGGQVDDHAMQLEDCSDIVGLPLDSDFTTVLQDPKDRIL